MRTSSITYVVGRPKNPPKKATYIFFSLREKQKITKKPICSYVCMYSVCIICMYENPGKTPYPLQGGHLSTTGADFSYVHTYVVVVCSPTTRMYHSICMYVVLEGEMRLQKW